MRPSKRRTARSPASSRARRPPTSRWWCARSMPTTGSAARRAPRRWRTTRSTTRPTRGDARRGAAAARPVGQDAGSAIAWSASSGRWLRATGTRRARMRSTAAVAKLLGGSAPEPCSSPPSTPSSRSNSRAPRRALVATVANEQAPESVRSAALKALDAFGGNDVLAAVDAAEKSSVPSLRLAALQIVAHRAPEQRAAHDQAFRDHGSEAEQQAAFQALAATQTAEAERAAGGRARSARGRQGAAGRAGRAARGGRARAPRPP